MRKWILICFVLNSPLIVKSEYWDVRLPSGTFYYSQISNLGLGITGSRYVGYSKLLNENCGIELYQQNSLLLHYGKKSETNFFGLSVSNNFIFYPYKSNGFSSLIFGSKVSYFASSHSKFKEQYFLFTPSLGYYNFLGNISVEYGIPFGQSNNFEKYSSGISLSVSVHIGDLYLIWD